jgi:hypothetical protein
MPCKLLGIGSYSVILTGILLWHSLSKKSRKTPADFRNDNSLGSKELKTPNGLIT